MSRRSLLFLAAGFCLLGVVPGFAQNDLNKEGIISSLDRNGVVLATTDQGLYQSAGVNAPWQKIPTPPAMPLGRLAQKSPDSPELAYYQGTDPEIYSHNLGKGALYLSSDAGKTWTPILLGQEVMEVFLHPDGAIYAITCEISTAPLSGQKEADWSFENGANKVKTYETEHLLVSKDVGKTWKDITPALIPHFGLYGIFIDPKHPGLVCVRSEEMHHTSWTFFYQADDANYHWQQTRLDEWPGDRFPASPWRWNPPFNDSNLPATLGNFFQYPFPRTGNYPELPTKYLVSKKPGYQFHLKQPMPVAVSTFCMDPGEPFTFRDSPEVKKYWGVRIGPEGETEFNVGPNVIELYTHYPDHAEKLAAYARDSVTQVDQAHPYRRTIDLRQFYDFKEPGKYRVQIIHNDDFSGHPGRTVGTAGFIVTVVP